MKTYRSLFAYMVETVDSRHSAWAVFAVVAGGLLGVAIAAYLLLMVADQTVGFFRTLTGEGLLGWLILGGTFALQWAIQMLWRKERLSLWLTSLILTTVLMILAATQTDLGIAERTVIAGHKKVIAAVVLFLYMTAYSYLMRMVTDTIASLLHRGRYVGTMDFLGVTGSLAGLFAIVSLVGVISYGSFRAACSGVEGFLRPLMKLDLSIVRDFEIQPIPSLIVSLIVCGLCFKGLQLLARKVQRKDEAQPTASEQPAA